MAQHVDYAMADAAQYSYDEYDISKDQCWQRAYSNGTFFNNEPGKPTDTFIEDGTIAQTIKFALQRHDWDLIILQAGSSESANYRDHWYTSAGKQLGLAGYTQELIDYVNANDIEPATPFKFAWNMVWSSPKDPAVRRDSNNLMLLTEFEDSEYVYYKAMVKVLQEELEPNFDFEYVFPAGTTMQNLKSTKLTNAEIYRDYGHVTDFGRLAAAYTWYCTLTGTDIADCKIPPMNHKVLLDALSRNTGKDLELTEERKAILVEAVGNAIKNPYNTTASQYTN
jgi:hypothetical protein